jgi:hypothetical protein
MRSPLWRTTAQAGGNGTPAASLHRSPSHHENRRGAARTPEVSFWPVKHAKHWSAQLECVTKSLLPSVGSAAGRAASMTSSPK